MYIFLVFVHFLEELRVLKIAFEIYLPLGSRKKLDIILENKLLQKLVYKKKLHIFSFYGDVVRVKILPHKTPDVALVEFETATQACIARNHLDQVQMKGKFSKGIMYGFLIHSFIHLFFHSFILSFIFSLDHKLVVSFSRFGEIRASPGDEGVMEDFTGKGIF